METIELQLSPQTVQQAQQIAQARQVSLEQLLRELIEALAQTTRTDDPILGLFADEADLIDEVMETVMLDRSSRPLRHSDG